MIPRSALQFKTYLKLKRFVYKVKLNKYFLKHRKTWCYPLPHAKTKQIYLFFIKHNFIRNQSSYNYVFFLQLYSTIQ